MERFLVRSELHGTQRFFTVFGRAPIKFKVRVTFCNSLVYMVGSS